MALSNKKRMEIFMYLTGYFNSEDHPVEVEQLSSALEEENFLGCGSMLNLLKTAKAMEETFITTQEFEETLASFGLQGTIDRDTIDFILSMQDPDVEYIFDSEEATMPDGEEVLVSQDGELLMAEEVESIDDVFKEAIDKLYSEFPPSKYSAEAIARREFCDIRDYAHIDPRVLEYK